MSRKVDIGLNALIAVLALGATILLLLAVLSAVALMILTYDPWLYEIECYAISKRNESYVKKPPLQMIMFY